MADLSTDGSRLLGQVVIVTGGGSGYGKGIAQRFAREGAKVVIADIDEEGGRNSARFLPAQMIFQKANVTREDDWHALIKETNEKFGPVTCLVNNAGSSYKNKSTLEVTEADYDRCFDVNVKSIFYSTSAIIPYFLKQKKGGCIINVASVGATRPRPGLVWYNASKGAVCNATKGLAAEFGPHGIRVNSVCPLLGGTGLFEAFAGIPDTAENRAKFVSNVPLGRLCEPDDVAGASLFLASEDAKFITGINMEVDGGRAI